MTNLTGSDAELKELLESVYACGRVWSAWGYGTMTEEDFTPAGEDEDVLADLTAWRDAAAAAAVAADRDKLRARLGEALDGFYLTIRTTRQGIQVHGQIDDPEEVADTLHATLSRIAAEEKP